jgi:tRNA A37 methylthiotransferase MiaB
VTTIWLSIRERMTKRVFIKTYGCQMNVYDSARMAELMAPLGYAETERAEGADLVILNTCHIREKAAEKVFSELGTIRRLKEAKRKHGGRMVIAVAGCVAQAEGAEILDRGRRDPGTRAVCRPGVRPAGLSPAAGDGSAGGGRQP